MAAEKLFENRVKTWLKSQGIYKLGTPIQHMHVPAIGYYEKRFGNKMTTSGLPDMHIVINGISLEVEVKAPNGRPSDMQKCIIAQINRANCYGAILYEDSSNFPKDGFGYYIDYDTFKEVVRYYADKSQ